MLRDFERAAYAIVVPVVALCTFQFAHGLLVAPLTRELAALEAQIKESRTKSTWVQGVREKAAVIERQLELAAPLDREIGGFLVGEADRIRIGEARDKALQNLDAKYIPQDGARMSEFNVETAEDLDLELSKLKKTFQDHCPKGANLGNWTAQSTVALRRVDETFTLECSFDALIKFITRIEASTPMLEVTRLQARGLQTQGATADQVQATVTVSALSFPVDEE